MQLLESVIKIQMINIIYSILYKVKCHYRLTDQIWKWSRAIVQSCSLVVLTLTFTLTLAFFYPQTPQGGLKIWAIEKLPTSTLTSTSTSRLLSLFTEPWVVRRAPCVNFIFVLLSFIFCLQHHVQKVSVFFTYYILWPCTGTIKLYNTSWLQWYHYKR